MFSASRMAILGALSVASIAIAMFVMGPGTSPKSTPVQRASWLTNPVQLPELPTRILEAGLKSDEELLRQSAGDAPGVQRYMAQAKQAQDTVQELVAPFAVIRTALASGDFVTAQQALEPQLLADVESAMTAVEVARDSREELVATGMLPPPWSAEAEHGEPAQEEKKEFWDHVLEALEFIAKILFLVLQLFGGADNSGTGGAGGPGGVLDAPVVELDSGAASDLSAHMAGGAGTRATAYLIRGSDGEHIVATTTNRAGQPAILLALNKNLNNPLELPVALMNEEGAEHDLVDAFRRGKVTVTRVINHGASGVTLGVESDRGEKFDLRWVGDAVSVEKGRG